MVAATSVPVGLIPVARGGTNLAQWSPDLACMGGESLYGSMLLSVLAAGGRVRGVLWYQGESDSGTAESAELYRAAHRTLVEAIRRDLGAETRFLQVQLCRNVLIPVSVALPWSQVRVHQVDAETGADGWVASIDVEMVDPIHVGTEGLRRIGRRLARLAQGRAEPIRVAAVERSGTLGEWPAALRVRIAFSGLRGGLRPRLHLPGFSVRSPDGEEVSMIYRAEVLPDDRHAVVLSLSGVPRTPEDGIWYGFGANPYCDLVDEEDNAVPSFGPIPLVPPG
jgi:sialate O-acetylesterase